MTKYSRETWKKNDLQSAVQASGGNPRSNSYQNYNNGYQSSNNNVNNQDAGSRTRKSYSVFGGAKPRYGSNACQLCARGKIPEDLSLHVTQQSTCGDVHLRLSLLDPSDSMCATGQESYRDYCCPEEKTPVPLKPSIGVAVGVLLFWLFTKKVRATSSLRSNADKSDNYHNMKDGSGIELKKSSSRSQKSLLAKVYEVALDSRSHSSKKSAKMKKSRKDKANGKHNTKSYEPPTDSRSRTISSKGQNQHVNTNQRYDEESYMTETTDGDGTYALDYRSPDSRNRYIHDNDQSTLQYDDESTMVETIEASYAPNVRAPSFQRMQQHIREHAYYNNEYVVDDGTVDNTYAGETINDDTVVAVYTQLV